MSEQLHEVEQLYKVEEVARRLRVSPSTIYNVVETGEMPCYRIGKGRGAIRIAEAHIQQFLRNAEHGPVGGGHIR
jgi:excisionase family DNA binding protein